jgi:hypothetical protein
MEILPLFCETMKDCEYILDGNGTIGTALQKLSLADKPSAILQQKE